MVKHFLGQSRSILEVILDLPFPSMILVLSTEFNVSISTRTLII